MMTAAEQTVSEEKSRWIKNLQHAGALVHAASHSARELTHLVAEIHGTITRLPSPLNRRHEADISHAPFPYRIVAGAFDLIAKAAGRFAPVVSEFEGAMTLRTQAALNGVSGDKLARWNSPLAFPMTLRDGQGRELDWQDWSTASAVGHVIVLHGLCCCDIEWQNPAATAFTDELQAQGYAVGWLRYNTGKAIHANGEELDAWLEDFFGSNGTPLLLMGHSMGGLLIRSACYWAEKEQHTWTKRLSHIACLGTPHLGAPLERLGNQANSLLGLTPYTKPLMRLGNIRSRGIKDLRHGWITPDHTLPALPQAPQILFLACAINDNHRDNLVGDGWVPVSSGLAMNANTEVLSSPNLQREFINDLSHIPIMADARVFSLMREWLGMQAADTLPLMESFQTTTDEAVV
jgi:pimeloyl-ACP methyl ester carboxylesterase